MTPSEPVVTPADDPLSVTLTAVANDTRRAVLAHLTGGASTTADIAAHLGCSVSTARRHVAILAEAGLVSRTRAGRTVLVRLDARPLERIEAWAAGYRQFWAAPGLDTD